MDIKYMEFISIFLVLFTMESAMGTECVQTLPENCTCFLDEYDGGPQPHIKCNNTNFRKFPDDLPQASILRIENDNIEILTEIKYNSSIKQLALPRNHIRLIVDGAFSNLQDLTRLNLEDNEITGIRKETFLGLKSLRILVLMNNPIYHINIHTFDGKVLPQLGNLGLSRCRLYEIEDGAIDSLTELTTLTMTHNNLKALPALGCSSPMEHLVTWDLSNNEISDIHKQFCSLPKLQHLHLSNNKIETLNDTFLGTAIYNLRSLYLKANKISYVDPQAFSGSMNLTLLDLTQNKLVHLEESGLPWDSLESLYVHDNPWFCGCANLWLVSRSVVGSSNNQTRLRCDTPAHLSNESVFHLHKDVFAKCGSEGPQIAGIIIAIIIVITVVIVAVCFILHRQRSRRQYRQNKNTTETGLSSPNVGGSKYYKMDNDTTELAVSYRDLDNGNHDGYRDGSGDAGEPSTPVWREMNSINNYQTTKPCQIV